jgi:DNA-directed RNA polymerase subunit alpha
LSYLGLKIEELELGVRTYHGLKGAGIETIGELVTKTEAQLLEIPTLGASGVDDVRNALASLDLRLAD